MDEISDRLFAQLLLLGEQNTRIEGALVEMGRRSDERHRETKQQLAEAKGEIERLSKAVQALNADDKVLAYQLENERARINALETRMRHVEEDRDRLRRESHDGDHMTEQALKAAMLIVEAQNKEVRALAIQAKETNEAVMTFISTAAKSPTVQRALRYAVPAFVAGGFAAGALYGLLSRVPSLVALFGPH